MTTETKKKEDVSSSVEVYSSVGSNPVILVLERMWREPYDLTDLPSPFGAWEGTEQTLAACIGNWARAELANQQLTKWPRLHVNSPILFTFSVACSFRRWLTARNDWNREVPLPLVLGWCLLMVLIYLYEILGMNGHEEQEVCVYERILQIVLDKFVQEWFIILFCILLQYELGHAGICTVEW